MSLAKTKQVISTCKIKREEEGNDVYQLKVINVSMLRLLQDTPINL